MKTAESVLAQLSPATKRAITRFDNEAQEYAVEVSNPTCPAEPQLYECDYQGFFSGTNKKNRDFDILYLLE